MKIILSMILMFLISCNTIVKNDAITTCVLNIGKREGFVIGQRSEYKEDGNEIAYSVNKIKYAIYKISFDSTGPKIEKYLDLNEEYFFLCNASNDNVFLRSLDGKNFLLTPTKKWMDLPQADAFRVSAFDTQILTYMRNDTIYKMNLNTYSIKEQVVTSNPTHEYCWDLERNKEYYDIRGYALMDSIYTDSCFGENSFILNKQDPYFERQSFRKDHISFNFRHQKINYGVYQTFNNYEFQQTLEFKIKE